MKVRWHESAKKAPSNNNDIRPKTNPERAPQSDVTGARTQGSIPKNPKKRPKRRTLSKRPGANVALHSALVRQPQQSHPESDTAAASAKDVESAKEQGGEMEPWDDSMVENTVSEAKQIAKKTERDADGDETDLKWRVLGLPNPCRLSLEHPWTLYFDVDWRCRHNLFTITNVAEFWSVINNVPCPTNSPLKCNWSLFKYNIQPEWEDDHNKNGGKWNMDLGTDRALCDKIWLNLLMGVIGLTLDPASEINGVTLHLRPGGIRCALWTAGTNLETQKVIGSRLRQLCQIPEDIKLHYKLQSEAIEKNSSYETQVTLVM